MLPAKQAIGARTEAEREREGVKRVTPRFIRASERFGGSIKSKTKMTNEELKTLCRLNNVSLYCIVRESEVRWHACEAIVNVVGSDFKASCRSGFGESPEVAIADCKQQEFTPYEPQKVS